jgi:hypothetical protein
LSKDQWTVFRDHVAEIDKAVQKRSWEIVHKVELLVQILSVGLFSLFFESLED